MSEHADSNLDFRCGICGRSLGGLRCHHCFPIQAPDQDGFLAEWAALPAAERLGRIPRWIEALSGVIALNAVRPETTPEELGFAVKRLYRLVALCGDGDLGLGLERLRALEQAKRAAA